MIIIHWRRIQFWGYVIYKSVISSVKTAREIRRRPEPTFILRHMVDHQALGPAGEVCSLSHQSLPDDLQSVQKHCRPVAKEQTVHVAIMPGKLEETSVMI